MRWLDRITKSTEMSLSNLQEIMEERGTWCATVSMRLQRVGYNLAIEQQQSLEYFCCCCGSRSVVSDSLQPHGLT